MSNFQPMMGDRVKIVGFHNDDALSNTPDKFIGKVVTLSTPANSFREGTFQFGCVEGDLVFFAAIVEPVFETTEEN